MFLSSTEHKKDSVGKLFPVCLREEPFLIYQLTKPCFNFGRKPIHLSHFITIDPVTLFNSRRSRLNPQQLNNAVFIISVKKQCFLYEVLGEVGQ
jgi:hypothetical protein